MLDTAYLDEIGTENLEQICIGRKFEKDKQWLLSKWLKKLQILKSWKMVRKISEKKRLDFGVPNEVLRDWIFWSIDGEDRIECNNEQSLFKKLKRRLKFEGISV